LFFEEAGLAMERILIEILARYCKGAASNLTVSQLKFHFTNLRWLAVFLQNELQLPLVYWSIFLRGPCQLSKTGFYKLPFRLFRLFYGSNQIRETRSTKRYFIPNIFVLPDQLGFAIYFVKNHVANNQ